MGGKINMNNSTTDFIIEPPKINPIAEGVKRPLWSVMIPTFNCAKYLQQTLESVLAQDPGPEIMQIEVIDDCSTQDDPESVVNQVGKGRVSFYRKEKNEGAIANFNTCIERSKGHLVHILHGDDWVENGFYIQVQNTFEKKPEIGICIPRAFMVDEEGEIDYLSDNLQELEFPSNCMDFLYYKNPVITPGVVVRRELYEKYGGFLPQLRYAADWEMWIRIGQASNALFINKPLLNYRIFNNSDTSQSKLTGDNIREYLRFADIIIKKETNFNYQIFANNVKNWALQQIEFFRSKGDLIAYEANLKVFQELFPSEKRRIHPKRIVRRIWNIIDRSVRKLLKI